MNTSSASDGIVCTTSTDNEHEIQVFDGVSGDIAPDAPVRARRFQFGLQESRTDIAQAHAIEVGQCIQPRHLLIVEALDQHLVQSSPGTREALDEILPHVHDRMVFGEEFEVVLKDDEIEFLQLAVGGIHVDEIDLACGDCVIFEGVLDDSRACKAHAVVRTDTRPAVRAVQVTRPEGGCQFGMLPQVRDGLQAQPPGEFACHSERGCVVKAERFANRQSAAGQPLLHIHHRFSRGIVD
jgi:hypothetical protein